MEGDHQGSPVFVMLENSPDARLLIELSSHAADLFEAHHALDLGVRSRDEGSAFADAGAYLIGFAVVAYCRTILHSNVRKPLTDHIAIPPELVATHETVRLFRNRTIAHSQSELSVTYPYGVLDRASLRVRDVSAVTVKSPLPRTVVEQFQELLVALQERLENAIEPVRARLEIDLLDSDRTAMVALGAKPSVLNKSANEFNPRTKRPHFPYSHTQYWD